MSALIAMLIVAFCSWLFCAGLDVRADGQTLRTLAEIGATLLVAYGVVASSIVAAAQTEARAQRKERVGVFIGIGAAGLIGIGSALVLSQRAWVKNPSWLEELAFGWATGSLLMLLAIVALQADAIDSWEKTAPAAGRSRWLTRNRRSSN